MVAGVDMCQNKDRDYINEMVNVQGTLRVVGCELPRTGCLSLLGENISLTVKKTPYIYRNEFSQLGTPSNDCQ